MGYRQMGTRTPLALQITVVLYGAILARDFQANFKTCKIGLLELSPFRICYEVRSSDFFDDLAVIMYKIFPIVFETDFTIFQVYTHSQKLRVNCYISKPRTEAAKGNLHNSGSVLWNKIPSEIRQRPSLKILNLHCMGKTILK